MRHHFPSSISTNWIKFELNSLNQHIISLITLLAYSSNFPITSLALKRTLFSHNMPPKLLHDYLEHLMIRVALVTLSSVLSNILSSNMGVHNISLFLLIACATILPPHKPLYIHNTNSIPTSIPQTPHYLYINPF